MSKINQIEITSSIDEDWDADTHETSVIEVIEIQRDFLRKGRSALSPELISPSNV